MKDAIRSIVATTCRGDGAALAKTVSVRELQVTRRVGQG